ncbi:MAG: type II and III secretion system protein family protein [bacterium]
MGNFLIIHRGPNSLFKTLKGQPSHKTSPAGRRLTSWVFAALAGLMLLGPFTANAQSLKLQDGLLLEEQAAPVQINITFGKSKILDSTETIQRVSVTDTKVADVVIISPHQVLINGKRAGSTSLIIWKEDGTHNVFDLWITPNVELVRERLEQLLPNQDIEVDADRDKIVLSGEVHDIESMERVISVVLPHSPELINLLRIKGPQQVQLQVRIAIVSRPALRQAGISFTADDTGGSTDVFGGLHAPGSEVVDIVRALAFPSAAFTPAFSLAFLATDPDNSVSSFLSLLESQGFARTLAEPTLVAISGQTASFLSGGEFPFAIVTEDQIDIEFKPFGVRLDFTPTVLADETIWLKVAPEVSEVSFEIGTEAGVLLVPGILAQRAETTIKLKDGQTFVIAGLLKDEIESNILKIPILGSIPILGALFRQVRHTRRETELLIAVTPRLVKPLGPNVVIPMPGDEAVYDPDDFELFLLGKLTHAELGKKTKEQKAMNEFLKAKAGPGGYLGFIK